MLRLLLLRLLIKREGEAFSKKNFTLWVDLQPPGSAIGISNAPYHCPISRYMGFATGKNWKTELTSIGTLDKEDRLMHQDWSREVVGFVDSHKSGFQVYREEMLDFLKTL